MPIYPWEPACMKAFLETDKSLVHTRIVAARSNIVERLHRVESISKEEQTEMENALKHLKFLKKGGTG